MSRLVSPEPDPPKRKRAGRRRRMHPEAKMTSIREAVAARQDVPPTGWRYPYGYLVKAYAESGSRVFLNAPDYLSAVKLRKELMLQGRYWMVWLEQRVE